MKRIWGILSATTLAACSGMSTHAPGNDVGHADFRPAAPVVAARMAAGDLASSSLSFARSQKAALGLLPKDDFRVIWSGLSTDGLGHTRLQQLHDGIKVWGADVVVHATDDGQLDRVDGNLAAQIKDLDLAPSIDDGAAVATAKRDYARAAAKGAPLGYAREGRELVILPLDGGKARLCWHVTFFTEAQAGLKPGRWNYFVDAHDGSIVHSFNALDSAVVEASGPGGNARVSRTWNMDLDATQSGSSYTFNTTQFETTDMQNGTSGKGTDLTGTSLNPLTTDKAANDAHGFAIITLKMLKDWFGYNSIDNNGFQILSRVHYSSNYDNAFWDGQEMTYGDGDGSTFYEFTGALDVIAHEIDHGFTENHANLTYNGQSGGMNESFSDIAGTTAKFYYDAKTADFNLGSDIYIMPNKYIRWMCTPTMDGQSIDNAADYNSGLDVHYTSGVMNKAFCRAAKRLSGVDPDTGTATPDGVKKAAHAWYVANETYWTSSTNWAQGCQGVVDAATKSLMYMPGEISALGDSWKDVGVTCTYTHVNDFTFSVTPATQMAMAGTKATYMVTTGLTSGNTAQSVALSVTGLPSGVTGTFTPATVMSGANATLDIETPYDAPLGDIKFTVTATGTTTHTADATLTVTAPPPDLAPPPADMAGVDNTGGNGGSGGNGGGNGLAGNGSSSGCSVAPGAAGGATGALFLVFLVVGLRARRALAPARARRR